jgi:hypothetical protein
MGVEAAETAADVPAPEVEPQLTDDERWHIVGS